MDESSAPDTAVTGLDAERVRTPWTEFWRKFRKQHVALVAGGFVLALVAVAVLQFVQTIATLVLPSLTADIINKGIATGNTTYIWHVGVVMVAITLGQVLL